MLAHPNRLATEPLDLKITVNVTMPEVEEVLPEPEHDSSADGPTLIVIFSTVLFLAATSFTLTLLHYKRKLNLRRTCQNIKSKRCCKKRPPKISISEVLRANFPELDATKADQADSKQPIQPHPAD